LFYNFTVIAAVRVITGPIWPRRHVAVIPQEKFPASTAVVKTAVDAGNQSIISEYIL
jgi:hypothetical protein